MINRAKFHICPPSSFAGDKANKRTNAQTELCFTVEIMTKKFRTLTDSSHNREQILVVNKPEAEEASFALSDVAETFSTAS